MIGSHQLMLPTSPRPPLQNLPPPPGPNGPATSHPLGGGWNPWGCCCWGDGECVVAGAMPAGDVAAWVAGGTGGGGGVAGDAICCG